MAVPFERVGLRWDLVSGSLAVLELRTSPDGQLWTPWTVVPVTWREAVARNGHVDTDGGLHDRVQVRVRGDAPESVTFLAVEAIQAVRHPGPAPEIGTLEQALAPDDLVHPRSDWRARPPACVDAHAPRRIYIHHTVTPFDDPMTPAARMRQMQSFHMDTRGWCDIGYHYVVAPDGSLWQARHENRLGAHVADNNSGSVGISFMGNYMNDRPTDPQLRQAGRLVSWLRANYPVQERLLGHRDSGQTSCPGDHLYARLRDMAAIADGEEAPGGNPDDARADPPAETGRYRGIVYVAPDTDNRIAGARVLVEGRDVAVRANDNGHWAFDLPAGEYTVVATADGYRGASSTRLVVAGADVWGSIGLESPDPPEPEPEPDTEPDTEPEPPGTDEPAPDDTAPIVVIESPADGTVTARTSILVKGTVHDDRDEAIGQVEVAGAPVDVLDGLFVAEVALAQGENHITAFAIDSSGNLGHAEVTITRQAPAPGDPDSRGPRITVLRPTDGQVVAESPVVVEGQVDDRRIGVVAIDGVPVPVDTGLFVAAVQLEVGDNSIEITAVGLDGNVGRAVVNVRYEPAVAGVGPHGRVPADLAPVGSAGDVSLIDSGRGSLGCTMTASAAPRASLLSALFRR